MRIVVRFALLSATAATAAWTVVKSPLPSAATVIVLVPRGVGGEGRASSRAATPALAGTVVGCVAAARCSAGMYPRMCRLSSGATWRSSHASVGPKTSLPTTFRCVWSLEPSSFFGLISSQPPGPSDSYTSIERACRWMTGTPLSAPTALAAPA